MTEKEILDLRNRAGEKVYSLFGDTLTNTQVYDDGVGGIHVVISLAKRERFPGPIGITYDNLKELSEFFKTTDINVETQFGFSYSEYTPGEPSSCNIHIRIEETT